MIKLNIYLYNFNQFRTTENYINDIRGLIKNEYKNNVLDEDYKEWTLSTLKDFAEVFNIGGYKWY